MKFTKQIPKKIEKCPIAEAIVEIRFAPNIDRSAVFGILYNNLKDSYSESPQKLPILELPDHIRTNDPGLRYSPYYKLQRDSLSCHIGPDVFSTIAVDPYPGWDVFSTEIFSNIEHFKRSNIVERVERIGIRYINFFPSDVLNDVELTIHITNEVLDSNDTSIVTSIEKDNYVSRVEISGNRRRSAGSESYVGTLIDIDTVYSGDVTNFFENAHSIIKAGHSVEKKIFFNLLKEDLIERLKPTY